MSVEKIQQMNGEVSTVATFNKPYLSNIFLTSIYRRTLHELLSGRMLYVLVAKMAGILVA